MDVLFPWTMRIIHNLWDWGNLIYQFNIYGLPEAYDKLWWYNDRGFLPFKSIHYSGSGWGGEKLTQRNPKGAKPFKLSFSYLAAHLSCYRVLIEPQSTLFPLRKHVSIYTYTVSLSVSTSPHQSWIKTKDEFLYGKCWLYYLIHFSMMFKENELLEWTDRVF